MTIQQAETKIIRTVSPAWHDRALDMFRHMANSLTTVSNLRINGDWPTKGSSITFTRDADGKRIKMWLSRNKFKAVAK